MRAAVILLTLLAGCRQGPAVEAENASVAEVADEVRRATDGERFIQPGKWVSTVTFDEMIAPGMPAEAAEQMRRMMGEGRRYESCLTPEEAERPNENFFPGTSDQCRYEHFTMRGGNIDARMNCAQGDISQVMEIDGDYSRDRYSFRMTTRLEGAPAPAGDMQMRMRVEAQRTGECDAVGA